MDRRGFPDAAGDAEPESSRDPVAQHAVPGAATGLCSECQPRDRPDGCAAPDGYDLRDGDHAVPDRRRGGLRHQRTGRVASGRAPRPRAPRPAAGHNGASVTLIRFVPPAESDRIRRGMRDPYARCRALADAARINTLSMIEYAGSGHIGTSFSAMDLVAWIWTEELADPGPQAAGGGDRYFSSKGHDVPGLYALLIGLGMLDAAYLTGLRRMGGLPGHPDRSTPYMITNTGSLGMGISKARGMALANRLDRTPGRIFVLTGDGELQEGQFWESLQPTANGAFSEITVIVDHNKLQSDTFVDAVSPLGDLEAKIRAFGWAVERC